MTWSNHATPSALGEVLLGTLKAKAFCRWLSELSGHFIDLPTEAQWEFAARGEEGRDYPWGDEKPNESLAWFGKDWEANAPLAVGSLPESRGSFGHLDLAGNVWEWCRDAWEEGAYERRGTLTIDPVGSMCGRAPWPMNTDKWRALTLEPAGTAAVDDDPDVVRACRGGAYGDGPRALRSAFRGRYVAVMMGNYLGFRVAALPASR